MNSLFCHTAEDPTGCHSCKCCILKWKSPFIQKKTFKEGESNKGFEVLAAVTMKVKVFLRVLNCM